MAVWSFPRWPPAAILNLIQPEMAGSPFHHQIGVLVLPKSVPASLQELESSTSSSYSIISLYIVQCAPTLWLHHHAIPSLLTVAYSNDVSASNRINTNFVEVTTNSKYAQTLTTEIMFAFDRGLIWVRSDKSSIYGRPSTVFTVVLGYYSGQPPSLTTGLIITARSNQPRKRGGALS